MDKIRNPQSQSDFDAKADRRFSAGALFLYLAVFFTLSAGAAWAELKPVFSPVRHMEAARRSVIDYFSLLAQLGSGDPVNQQEKRQLLLPQCHPIIDVRHDYLLVHPELLSGGTNCRVPRTRRSRFAGCQLAGL